MARVEKQKETLDDIKQVLKPPVAYTDYIFCSIKNSGNIAVIQHKI